MKKFEYKVIRLAHLTEEKLHQMGRWGWQLQFIERPSYAAYPVYYFMREITKKRKVPKTQEKKND